MSDYEKELREEFRGASRIVVKIGTSCLVDKSRTPNTRRIASLVRELSALMREGREVVLVSSGAIGAGMKALRLSRRPGTIPELQMAAAVGQVELMSLYARLFKKEGFAVGQVLLTHGDLQNRTRHLNARNTVMKLMRNGIVPIVNENDVVSVNEIKVGDNDVLAALVSVLIDTDLLVLLTSADGLRDLKGGSRSKRVPYLEAVTKKALSLASGKGSALGVGGMLTKLEAAKMAVVAGTKVVIADGRKSGSLKRIIEGADTGTAIGRPGATDRGTLRGRKRWVAFFHRAEGSLIIDDGAVRAIVKNGNSLLPIGVRKVVGRFEAGALVNIQSHSEELIARGLVDYSSSEINQIKGKKTGEIRSILGSKDFDEIVHRDNMVLPE